MSGHELNTHSTDIGTVAGHRMGYHEHESGALYGLKSRASEKRYLVMHLGLRLLTIPRPALDKDN
jgi:hypothetical protein